LGYQAVQLAEGRLLGVSESGAADGKPIRTEAAAKGRSRGEFPGFYPVSASTSQR
jgi:hypothetical protein